MQRLLSIACVVWLAASAFWAGAQSPPPRNLVDPATVQQSRTRQFIVHTAPETSRLMVVPSSLSNIVQLEPSVTLVTCERIKTALLRELGARDQWQNHIHLRLHHAMSLDETVVIKSDALGGGWVYTIELPDKLDRTRLVTALTETLLLEIAGRDSHNSPEIPPWLGEGLSRQLMSSSGTNRVGLIVDPPREMVGGIALTRQKVEERVTDPLVEAHRQMLSQPPLSLAELSWPEPAQLEGDAAEVFAGNAQFFVHSLLLLPDGPACLQAMLRELPAHLNWQISFFHAFHRHFATPLDLEKWWALQLVEFTGRDLAQTWPPAESWAKLDELLHPAVEVRTRADELPLRAQATLQAIVLDWDVLRQTRLLREKINQLLLLRMRISPNLLALVDNYRTLLEYYVNRRNHTRITLLGMTLYTRNADSMARDAVQQLNQLDQRREKLRPAPPNPLAISQSR